MIIGNLNVESMALFPSKTHSKLIVDAHAVLSRAVSLQRLEPICRRRRKVAKLLGVVDLNQSPKRYGSNGLKSSHAALMENRFRIPVAKRTDQTNIILRITLNVQQEIGDRGLQRDVRPTPA